MNLFTFHLSLNLDLDTVWQQLQSLGCKPLYSIEENDEQRIIASDLPPHLTKENIIAIIPGILTITEDLIEPIDWKAQWTTHAPGYTEGYALVDLTAVSPNFSPISGKHILKLEPGPGFGDLSHPTTRLVLKLMGDYIKGKHVLDIGCGSGILSLAAQAMEAVSVTGIDIDPEALRHAALNAEINEMDNAIIFTTPKLFCKQPPPFLDVVLMNMIASEQKQAWKSLPPVHKQATFVVTSGILADEQDEYLAQCQQWGWKLIHTLKEEKWMGYVFFQTR